MWRPVRVAVWRRLPASSVVLILAVLGGLRNGTIAGSAQTAGSGGAPLAGSSAGPLADSCGVPAAAEGGRGQSGGRGTPIFGPGQYPVQLPPSSLLGARNDLPNPYRDGVHWGQLPDGRRWGSTAGIYAAPDGRSIWVIDRCGASGAGGSACLDSPLDPILQFDTSGKLLKSFGRGVIVSPHKITVDRDGNLWVADNGSAPGKGHQVHKFSPDGKLLMSLGKAGVAGAGLDEFDQPTEVAVAPNGDIFVADGHSGGGGALGNARVMKFDKTGKFLKTWGKKGMGPGEFDVLHTLALDLRGRLFVGDRQNNRIQIFDQDGRLIALWYQFGRPSGMYIDRNDILYVADSESRDGRTNTGQLSLPQTGYGFNPGARRGIRIGSARDGSVRSFVPDPCPYPYAGGSTLAEGVTTDAEGNLYGADFLGTVRKFIRK
ncbi:MAG: peptidyl-alpha-hydroxyglycine alpha-amidating lyase family protein [Vicinamibacterales bacterium]